MADEGWVAGLGGASAAELLLRPRHGGIVRPDGTGRWLFDLWAANRRSSPAGVPDTQIQVAALPTGPDRAGRPGSFFSDRAARPCGRFAPSRG